MKTIIKKIATEKQLKTFVSIFRSKIISINGISFKEVYPMLEVTNKHASYYDVKTQGNKFLNSPFNVEEIK
jgi:hypothetical protein